MSIGTAETAVRRERDDETTTEFAVDDGGGASASGTVQKRDRCTVTMLAGPMTGAIFTLEQDELVFGRGAEVSARIDDRGLSRQHARLMRKGDRFFIEDLQSTNGTYVNGESLSGMRELSEGDRLQLGPNALLRFHLHDAVEQEATRRLYELAVRDELTQLHNRRYLEERLQGELAYAQRHRTCLSVLILDVDHFKQVNDSVGHLAGDAVLRVVAATMQRVLRTEDLVARYGGEEFCVVARGIDARNAMIVGERLRRIISQLAIPYEGDTIRVTVSCGVATFSQDTWYGDVKSLLADADSSLYLAKENGRNRCIHSS
jgi:diguanylate cyclase (GGDEF)-like protein